MIEIDKKLHKEIKDYCKANGLIMKEYVNSLLKKAFTVDKFGTSPFSFVEEIKPVLPIDYEQAEEVEPLLPSDYEQPLPIETIAIKPQPVMESVVITHIHMDEKSKKENEGVLSDNTVEKKVPNKYYSELTIEAVNNAAKEIQKQTKKPKKRNL